MKRVFTPVVPLLVDKPTRLTRAHPWLAGHKERYVALLTASLTELQEYGIEPYRNGDSSFDAADLQCILQYFAEKNRPVKPPVRTKDFSKAILDEVNKDSILQRVQSCLYRIKDKRIRTEVQVEVYRYLLGRGKLPDTGFPFIQTALTGELVGRFRRAVKESKKLGIEGAAEKYSIDRFEIAFVLTKA